MQVENTSFGMTRKEKENEQNSWNNLSAHANMTGVCKPQNNIQHITYNCINSWNLLSTEIYNFCTATPSIKHFSSDLSKVSRPVLRSLIKKFFLHSYTEKMSHT